MHVIPGAAAARCPDCGTELGSGAGTEGLCPRCLLSLALVASALDEDSGAGSRVETAVGSDPEAATSVGPTTGRILGERYQMREMLGRGGMGEVWRAFDLKLRVDVALKSVRTERRSSEKAHELLRQEVRAAREVVSPNVCRIFDLVLEEGRELVSMEYIDGETLTETLLKRGPLELQEAREIASQFLSGLEAIHQAGLAHRDFKPENVMLTRAGRVVVMDFGLAKALGETRTGSISGTPAYMPPEQARGESVDARADVFAAGVVLAEMLVVGGEGGLDARRALWKGIRKEPPQVPEGPWAPVLEKALRVRPADRPASARALALALEEVTLRLPGFEDKRPYPGLAPFTAEDAEYFFGREAEVEAVWKKMKRPRLLGLIGPSGTGKSSFVRAGLLPTLPSTWAALVTTPGHRPFQSLGEALVPFFSGDTEAMQKFLRFDQADTAVELVSRWRKGHEHALVVVDQFEELVTLNPPDVQASFADLLARLVLEADVHVLLSLRDDFLVQCQFHEPLTPILNELTVLGPLGDSALRRALVQPALACGYRFEDEGLVDEMVAEVGGERGALPLLAFAASRLWEKRDRDRGLLTRQAYQEIGGVAGALAQHAEATLDRIGTQRVPLVRELFRNLVTAQGTRAVRERVELLSVFEEDTRAVADEVLSALVDARLLTSFERAGDEDEDGRQEIEIIHESLLSRWPRLVRWQTQDADGAQLRDQLRQAAQAWQDRGEPEDLLWSGTAYRDFAVWKERYSGGLTATEEAFARAAERHATRRRRRRRVAAAAVVAALALGLGVVTNLWTRAEEARRRAEAESQRREAAQLVSLGRLRLEAHPMGALAHAIASLERIDNEPARRLALEALWRGPTSIVVSDVAAHTPAWSPDGRWLAVGGREMVLYDQESQRRSLVSGGERPRTFSEDSTQLITVPSSGNGVFNVRSVPDGALVRTIERGPDDLLLPGGSLLTADFNAEQTSATLGLRTLEEAEDRRLGRWRPGKFVDCHFDPFGRWVVWAAGGQLLLQRYDDLDGRPRVIGRHAGDLVVTTGPWRDRVVTSNAAGEVRLWDTESGGLVRAFQSPASARWVTLDPRGRFLATAPPPPDAPPGSFVLFDIQAPRGAEPVPLIGTETDGFLMNLEFDPKGRWLASTHNGRLALWNLASRRAFILRGEGQMASAAVAFTPDGRLLSTSNEGVVRLWALFHEEGDEVRVLYSRTQKLTEKVVGGFVAVDGQGRAIVGTQFGLFHALPLDGGAASTYQMEASDGRQIIGFPSLDPAGRRLALVSSVQGRPETASLRILDLQTWAHHDLRPDPAPGESCADELDLLGPGDSPLWLPDGRLVSNGATGFRLWDLEMGQDRLLHPCRPGHGFVTKLVATPDSRSVLGLSYPFSGGHALDVSAITARDLETGTSREIASHGTRVRSLALDPSGAILVTGSADGVVRVGPVSGEDPHLLYGHGQEIHGVAVSPDGRWIASISDDSIRIWPMPDGRPLHTLHYEELVAKLRAQTNLRVVPDPTAATGYTVEMGPLPAWAEPPVW